jgi:hypothetical protein
MSEDRETRTDEDVEGHANKLNADHVKLANDEGDDDVDAHMLKAQQKAQNKL